MSVPVWYMLAASDRAVLARRRVPSGRRPTRGNRSMARRTRASAVGARLSSSGGMSGGDVDGAANELNLELQLQGLVEKGEVGHLAVKLWMDGPAGDLAGVDLLPRETVEADGLVERVLELGRRGCHRVAVVDENGAEGPRNDAALPVGPCT